MTTQRQQAVTVEPSTRAESVLYFGNVVKDDGFAKFSHKREVTPIDKQLVVRMNRGTLYSAAVFDLDAGPVTISLPDAGTRLMSMQVINEDQYSPVVIYKSGSYTFTREQIGTRYLFVAVRTLVDSADRKDVAQAHALQNAIQVNLSECHAKEK